MSYLKDPNLIVQSGVVLMLFTSFSNKLLFNPNIEDKDITLHNAFIVTLALALSLYI